MMAEQMKRFNALMAQDDLRDLKALALANTGGNDSELVRLLIRLAVENPRALGLNAPIYIEGKALALAGALAA